MESDKHPTMRFDLTGVAPEGAAGRHLAVKLAGKLTLHGVTREVTMPGQVWKDGGSGSACGPTSRWTWATTRSAG